jgi:tRNA pseudouridine55 synthase
VAFTRRLLKTPRVGHTGTLDPLATGLLVLLVGHATRLSRFLVTDEKEYIADVRLGVATRTYDAASLDETATRCPMPDDRWSIPTELEPVLDRFRGNFLQTPPAFSAKKVAGVRAYEHARHDREVELEPVPVTVRELQVLYPSTIDHRPSNIGTRDATLLRLRVVATAGFYVRSLAHDLGQALGCGAHLEALRRTRAGRFRIEQAAALDQLQADPDPGRRLIPVNSLLSELPGVTLTAEGLRRAANGNPLGPGHLGTGVIPGSDPIAPVPLLRILDAGGETLAVAEKRPDGLLHPLVVLR